MIDLVAISSFTVLLPLIIAILNYRRLPKPAKYISWLLVIWFVAETISYVLRISGFNNWNVYLAVSLIEIVAVTLFYKSIFISNTARRISVWLALTGIAITVFEYAITKTPMNTFSLLFDSTFFFGMGLFAFYEYSLMDGPGEYRLLNISIMILFLGSAVYFSSWKFMKYEEHLFRLFGSIHAYFLIGCYVLFSISLWRLRQYS